MLRSWREEIVSSCIVDIEGRFGVAVAVAVTTHDKSLAKMSNMVTSQLVWLRHVVESNGKFRYEGLVGWKQHDKARI